MSSLTSLSEMERLLVLARYAMLDGQPDPEFNQITTLAARLFNAPIALVSLMEAESLRFKAKHGTELVALPREQTFCTYTILEQEPLIVPDATKDERFAHFPLVVGEPFLRFYAGAPLTTREGANLGTLCVMDTVPREFSESETATLTQLAATVMTLIEARLTERRLQLLESSVEHANDAILVTEAEPVDQPGPRIIYVNKAFTTVTGYTEEEVIGKTPRILQGPGTSEESKAKIRRALKRWKPVRIEMLNYRKDGSEFWVELNIVPVANEKGWYTHWVSVQRDITARKLDDAVLLQTKHEAEAAQAEAERANSAKSEFLSRMSHELRTPLNAILGFGQLLEIDAPTPRQREKLSHIMQGGNHLLGLINEVLDISRIESGKLDLTLESVPVADVCNDAAALIQPLATQRNVRVGRCVGSASGAILRADRQRLNQVMLNLLSNAVKYNRPGGTVSITCEPAHADRLRLAVSDSGVGIAAEDLRKLFMPFERLGAERSGVEGTGIGLALSKRLVEAMDGEIGVESTPGSGSTFYLELPAADSLPTTTEVAETEPLTIGGPTVLCIEDNPSNYTLVEQVLEATRPNIRLRGAMRGELGLDMARMHQPDLILLDLQLPDVHGDDLLQRLQADTQTCDIPVIMVTADATAGQSRRLLDLGAQAYLTKPLNIAAFLSAIDGVLGVKG